jgi:hypothetical protein
MNQTEERLRAATRAAARTVHDGTAPPLRLPAGPDQLPARRPGSPRAGWRRAVAPLAAAAAVIGVVSVSVVVTQGHGSPARGPASQPVPATLPRVAMMLVSPLHGPGAGVLRYLEVRATTTGQRLATIRPARPDNSFCDVTGTAGGRLFVAVACKVTTTLTPKATVTEAPHALIGIRLSSAGRVVSTHALPLAVPANLESVSVSPDGATLAAATADLSGAWPRDPAIALYSMASGRLLHRWSWSGTADISDRSYSAAVLSWTADSRTLAFPLTTGHRSAVQARLLDVRAPGRSLRRASRVAVTFGHVPVQVSVVGTLGNSDTLITPDGRLIVSGTTPPSDRPGTTGLAIAEFPVRANGPAGPARPVRTLDPVTAGGQFALYREVLWSNADGSVLIATGFRSSAVKLDDGSVIGTVTRNGFRPLPGSLAGVFQIAF